MASGDIIYDDFFGPITLDASQRTALRNLVGTLGWPGGMNNIITVVFNRDAATNTVTATLQGTISAAPGALPNRPLNVRGREP